MKLTSREQKLIDDAIDFLMSINIAEQTDYSVPKRSIKFYEWEDANENAFESHGIYVNHGATKMVFIVDVLENWVIKVPFLFSPETAPGTLAHCDARAAEAKVYSEAVDCEVSTYFAPTFHYKTVDGIPFYLQTRVNCNPDDNEDAFFSHVSADYDREDFETEDDYYDAVNSEVDSMDEEDKVIAIFGGWWNDLMSFIYDRNLNDFHTGNFGFIGERPVLIDYCGY